MANSTVDLPANEMTEERANESLYGDSEDDHDKELEDVCLERTSGVHVVDLELGLLRCDRCTHEETAQKLSWNILKYAMGFLLLVGALGAVAWGFGWLIDAVSQADWSSWWSDTADRYGELACLKGNATFYQTDEGERLCAELMAGNWVPYVR